jgi:hypothetical protein
MPHGIRNDPTVVPTELDAAYTAGFVDGEGTIYVRAQRRKLLEEKGWNVSAYALVVASQVDPRPLQWMQQRWGGYLRPIKNRERSVRERNAWEWGCSSRQAYKLLHDIRPYLRCKGAQADNAFRLEAMARPRGRSRGNPMTPEAILMQAEITAEARRLNQERPEWNELP